MRSDLSTFLPTLGLLGAVLKKIRLRTHKKHQKTQKIYSKDRWHCTSALEKPSSASTDPTKKRKPASCTGICHGRMRALIYWVATSISAATMNDILRIQLKNGLGYMYKRTREAIIRFHRFNEEKEASKLYRYLPWKDESTDLPRVNKRRKSVELRVPLHKHCVPSNMTLT